MSATLYTYIAYLLISVALTIWVGHTLHKNGRVFLVDVFAGREDLADSVNHLLVVGFYLINFGYVSLALKLKDTVTSATNGVEALSSKVGLVLVVLGGMHFFNLYVFRRIRSSKHIEHVQRPVAPDAMLPPAAPAPGSRR
jgi:Na+/serine symporter